MCASSVGTNGFNFSVSTKRYNRHSSVLQVLQQYIDQKSSYNSIT
ncbi:hypothetical protein B6N60_04256 [Richelia sinica FACHB-800]|uniref:Uncharacterized protein n=1 Tax=Richelia sinica FACHB-800 TaxID=1357546 RepID=A0A975TCT8_9NOST|nr:hypothetical protein B6N60_04256 [Richelia sinica FACHB-800]